MRYLPVKNRISKFFLEKGKRLAYNEDIRHGAEAYDNGNMESGSQLGADRRFLGRIFPKEPLNKSSAAEERAEKICSQLLPI